MNNANSESYITPQIKVMNIDNDILTFSEQEEWTGPMIDVGIDPMMEE